MRRECSRCLFYEGMQFYFSKGHIPEPLLASFRVEDDGRCTICHAYEAAFDRAAIERELTMFRATTLMSRGPAAVVALSGGKDSLSSLYLASKVLGVNVRAVLFQNGFIPERVVTQARDACDRLGVVLTVKTLDEHAGARFRSSVENASFDGPQPCVACARLIFRSIDEVLDETGAGWMVLGTNYYTRWTDRPYASAYHETPQGRRVLEIHLPYAMQITSADTEANLRELGVTPFEMSGVSTNCEVPGLVQGRLGKIIGHVPELEDLALESIVGHLPRAAAAARLARTRS